MRREKLRRDGRYAGKNLAAERNGRVKRNVVTSMRT
jgi:hypothetical protein